MSTFFKALEQAERDHLAGRTPPSGPTPSVATSAHPSGEDPIEPTPDPGHAASRHAGVDQHLVSLLRPASFEAEQYRALRHLIEHRKRVANLALIAVSSPVVGDGKTTTAVNLAGALAQHPGVRVLLIDADLRRPAIARLLGLASRHGLVDLIAKPGRPLDTVLTSYPPFGLDILPAGAVPEAPYELVRSPRFAEILAEARQRYDYVILDTPPLVDVPDGRVIAEAVDGMVVVVCAHRTPPKLLKEALSLVDPKRILGLVFNQDSRSVAGYHRYRPYTGNGER